MVPVYPLESVMGLPTPFEDFTDPFLPSRAECHEADCYRELGRGNPQDVVRVLEQLEDHHELAGAIAAVIKIHSQDGQRLAAIAAESLRDFLARQMAKQL